MTATTAAPDGRKLSSPSSRRQSSASATVTASGSTILCIGKKRTALFLRMRIMQVRNANVFEAMSR